MKSGQDTFDDALAALFSLAERHPLIYRAYNAVLAWLVRQPDGRAARGRIGSMISLGPHLRDSPAIAERRNATRALLLLMATHFGASQRELNEVKRRGSASPDALPRNITELLRYTNEIVPGGVGSFIVQTNVYDQATRLGTASILDTLKLGVSKAIELVNKAAWYIERWGGGGETFVRWFGQLDDTSAARVHENLRCIAVALLTKPIDFDADAHGSTRGIHSGWANSQRQAYNQFQEQTHIKINLAELFFDNTRTGDRSDEMPVDPARIDVIVTERLRLMQMKRRANTAFFKDIRAGANQAVAEAVLKKQDKVLKQAMDTNRARLGSRAKSAMMSAAGVIIHETSHNVVGTEDVTLVDLTMYGRNLCEWLARHHPERTIKNADTYRLFCEEFD